MINFNRNKPPHDGVVIDLQPVPIRLLALLTEAAPNTASIRQLESDPLRAHHYQLHQVRDRPFKRERMKTLRGRGDLSPCPTSAFVRARTAHLATVHRLSGGAIQPAGAHLEHRDRALSGNPPNLLCSLLQQQYCKVRLRPRRSTALGQPLRLAPRTEGSDASSPTHLQPLTSAELSQYA